IFDADRLSAIEQDARGQRIDLDLEIGAIERGHQISGRGAAPLAVSDRGLIGADAFLLRAIEIVRVGMASLLARLDKGLEENARLARIGDAERPLAAVKGAVAVLVAFGALEIGQHIGKTPTLKAELAPEIVVARMAADVDHAVDRGRPAKHLAARPEELAVVQIGLAFGVVVPVDKVGSDELADARRHMDEKIRILAARLQQQNLVIRILRQPAGENATGAARADDDVVKAAHGFRSLCYRPVIRRS